MNGPDPFEEWATFFAILATVGVSFYAILGIYGWVFAQ
jgi:hypothetical protein